MNDKTLVWLASGDTGTSSLTMLAVISGNEVVAAMIRGRGAFDNHPHDPADLGRCIRLLDLDVTLRNNIAVMRNISPEWAAMVDHWDELESLYREEETSGKAPNCYARMRELLDPIWNARYAERKTL